MIIRTLTLENFRKFKRQGFRFNPRFNVLIGRNATGKTQVLDALSIILSVYQIKFLRRATIERGIEKDEVRLEQTPYKQAGDVFQYKIEPAYPVAVSAQIDYRGWLFDQTCTKKTAKGRTTLGGSTPFSQLAEQEFQQVLNAGSITSPFLGYYGAGRLKPLHRRQTTPSNASSRTIDGYKDVLNPNILFDDMENWVKDHCLIEIYEKHTDVELEVVRRALRKTVSKCQPKSQSTDQPKCQDIYYNPSLKKVCLKYEDGTSEPICNLSDGCRCMTRMVFDIARRIATMNSPVLGAKALDETPGVALIDEIDLYLHPEWQRSVVENLKSAFPKLQFIATTHSPFIIQSLKPGELIDLENCSGQVYDVGEDSAEPTSDEEYFNRNRSRGR